MGSGFCLCARLAAAEGLRIATVGGGVPDAPRSGQDRSLQCKKTGGNGKAAGRACPAPTGWLCLCVGADSISARRRVRRRKVYGSPCRGRRPRRPAEVSGDRRYTGGMNSSPTDIPLTAVSREVAEGSRPLPTKQTVKGDSTVRLRAGHARPLQGHS